MTKATKASRNGGSSGSPAAAARVLQAMPHSERDHHHHRQQHRDAQHFGQHRVVADLGRDAVAGADDLRDVVNRAAEKDAGLLARRGRRACAMIG